MAQHIARICGGKPCFFVQQPYYLKHAPLNPAFGAVHDGTSTEYGKGFSVKPIHWLYRFRWNFLPRGITPTLNRNPGGKMMHWLEVSTIHKGMEVAFSGEYRPHLICQVLIVLFTIWQIGRYLLFHPELTLYMLAVYPTKVWMTQHRYLERHPMDKPVFRYLQRAPEFWFYDGYRDMIELGIIANDPYVDYMKSIGKGKELTLYADQRGPAPNGAGNLTHLLPFDWRRKKDDHHDSHDAHHDDHGKKAHH